MTDGVDKGVSAGRRGVLIAASAAVLAPGLSLAASEGATAFHHFGAGGEALVLSGCVTGADGRPLAGRTLEVRGAGGHMARAVTDGDGRFLLETSTPPGDAHLIVAAPGAGERAVPFARERARAGAAQLERDSAGTWRAAVALSFT